MDSKKLTKEQVEEFLEACKKDDEEKLRHLLNKGYRVDEYLPVAPLHGFDTIYTELLECFLETQNYSNLPKITQLFYEYGMIEDYWLEFIEDEPDNWETYYDDEVHTTPYFRLALFAFTDEVAETILIMIKNNLSQKGYNELVIDLLENIWGSYYYDQEKNSLEKQIEFLTFLASFPQYLKNSKSLSRIMHFNEYFDYAIFRSTKKLSFDLHYKKIPNNKTYDVLVNVKKDNEIIYSFNVKYRPEK